MQNSRCRLGALIENFTKCYNFLLENGKLLIGLGREVRKTNLTIILPNFYYSTPVGFYVDSVIALILVLSLVLQIQPGLKSVLFLISLQQNPCIT